MPYPRLNINIYRAANAYTDHDSSNLLEKLIFPNNIKENGGILP